MLFLSSERVLHHGHQANTAQISDETAVTLDSLSVKHVLEISNIRSLCGRSASSMSCRSCAVPHVQLWALLIASLSWFFFSERALPLTLVNEVVNGKDDDVVLLTRENKSFNPARRHFQNFLSCVVWMVHCSNLFTISCFRNNPTDAFCEILAPASAAASRTVHADCNLPQLCKSKVTRYPIFSHLGLFGDVNSCPPVVFIVTFSSLRSDGLPRPNHMAEERH
mmetsp:Transcript_43951/g.51487  ORF Transcript_43951/g.51487 Transcript_43951/m.51487 type:complete len:223 (+) Transcript_43951:166-834(+)